MRIRVTLESPLLCRTHRLFVGGIKEGAMFGTHIERTRFPPRAGIGTVSFHS